MSFDCIICGKNGVRKYGGVCSECDQQMFFDKMESQAIWFGKSRLCQTCGNAWGPDPCDKCEAYEMPLYMVARKRKCKRFKEIDYSKEPPDVWY